MKSIAVKSIIDEDFVNYKDCSMFIAFPVCNWKCEGCHNKHIAETESIMIDVDELVRRYKKNFLSHAFVCGGLDPIDSFDNLILLIETIRKQTNDAIVIYTGYTKDELIAADIWSQLKRYPNIIIKTGRYCENQTPHYDSVLGVWLANDEQQAEVL